MRVTIILKEERVSLSAPTSFLYTNASTLRVGTALEVSWIEGSKTHTRGWPINDVAYYEKVEE